jgi:hypothetical protein
MPPRLLRAALEYLERGWTPLPLQPRSKLPLIPWARLRQTRPQAKDLEQWWAWWPEANVGIITGRPSNVAVVDLDGPEAQGLAEQLGLPVAPTVRTGQGLHIYCSAFSAIDSAIGIRPGIDLRADGGYVVAPPSVHPSGRPYWWVVPPAEVLPPLPSWALPVSAPSLDARRRPNWVVTALRGVEQGRRNATCASLTGYFFAHGVSHDVIEASLSAWNIRNRPPLLEGELHRTIAAIVARGRQQRADALPLTEGTVFEYLSGPWSKDCTHGERSTYQAVCAVEHLRGLPPGTLLHVSYQELASCGSVSPQRCRPVLARLANRGYLEFHPSGQAGGLRGMAASVRRLPLPAIRR